MTVTHEEVLREVVRLLLIAAREQRPGLQKPEAPQESAQLAAGATHAVAAR